VGGLISGRIIMRSYSGHKARQMRVMRVNRQFMRMSDVRPRHLNLTVSGNHDTQSMLDCDIALQYRLADLQWQTTTADDNDRRLHAFQHKQVV
jgi:hypothetical protein